jgi:gas vesicle protein
MSILQCAGWRVIGYNGTGKGHMHMSDEDSGKLLWFVAGAAVGASVALLLAPASGEDTRRYLTKKAGEGREALSGTGKEIVDKGRDLYDKGRKLADEAADMFERGRKLVEG